MRASKELGATGPMTGLVRAGVTTNGAGTASAYSTASRSDRRAGPGLLADCGTSDMGAEPSACLTSPRGPLRAKIVRACKGGPSSSP